MNLQKMSTKLEHMWIRIAPLISHDEVVFGCFFPFSMTNFILEVVSRGTVVIVIKQKDHDSLSRPSELSPTGGKIN